MAETLMHDAVFIPPGPVPTGRDAPIWRQIVLAVTNPIEGWPRVLFEGGVHRPPVPGGPVYVVDPEAIRQVYGELTADFPQGALWRRMMRPVWGDGLVTSEGDRWRWQRHAVASAFRPAQMTALAPLMSRAAESAIARWRDAGPGATVDMSAETGRVTFDIILDAMLSGGADFERGAVRRRIEGFMAQLSRMRLSYFLAPDAFHERRITPAAPEAADLRRDIEAMVRRRRTAPPRGDLVDLLLAARDPETGQAMDDATLRDNLLGFIVAGHETSSVALAWALYLVSAHAPTRRRIRDEVAGVAGDGSLGPEHVDRLVFTRQVMQEAMRLYPPAPLLTRVCIRTAVLAGETVKAGTRVLIPTYALHRHRQWWRDPDVFDPDRFAPDAPPPDRFVYLPFGAGPRFCLGAVFAMTELVVILATLVRGADFEVVAGHRVWPVAGMALRPQGGLPMQVHVRV